LPQLPEGRKALSNEGNSGWLMIEFDEDGHAATRAGLSDAMLWLCRKP
jgi:hypothetical protein